MLPIACSDQVRRTPVRLALCVTFLCACCSQVASAAVYAQFGQLAGLRCAGFVLASILVIAWLNLR